MAQCSGWLGWGGRFVALALRMGSGWVEGSLIRVGLGGIRVGLGRVEGSSDWLWAGWVQRRHHSTAQASTQGCAQ